MLEIHFTQFFAYNLAFLAAAFLFGLALLSLMFRHLELEVSPRNYLLNNYLYAIGLGVFWIVLQLFLLAATQQLTAKNMSLVFYLSVAASVFVLIFNRKLLAQTLAWKSEKSEWIYFVVLLAAILVVMYTNTGMASLSDATTYHLPIAQLFLDNQGLAVNEQLRYPLHTFNFNLLYSLVLQYSNSNVPYAQSFHGMFVCLLVLTSYFLARRCDLSPAGALLVAIIMARYDICLNLMNMANVDAGGAFFIALATLALLDWDNNKARHGLFLASAIFLGMAMGTKYLHSLYALPIGFYILFATRSVKKLAIYAGLTALVGLWWYIRNAIISGNPVHPFASSVFGFYIWTEADILYQMKDLARTPLGEMSVLNFLQLPLQIHRFPLLSDLLAVVIAVFFASAFYLKGFSRTQRYMLMFSWPLLIFWFFSTQMTRYLTPTLPFITIMVVAFTLQVSEKILVAVKAPQKVALILCSTVLPLLLSVPVVMQFYQERERFHRGTKAHVKRMAETTPEEYFAKKNLMYEMFYVANQHFSESEKIFRIGMGKALFFYHGDVLGDATGPGRPRDVLVGARDPDNGQFRSDLFAKRLRERGASGLVMRKASPAYQLLDEKHFEIVFENKLAGLVRIKEEQTE